MCGETVVATLVATTTTTKKTNSNIQIWNLFVDRHRDCVFRCCRGRGEVFATHGCLDHYVTAKRSP